MTQSNSKTDSSLKLTSYRKKARNFRKHKEITKGAAAAAVAFSAVSLAGLEPLQADIVNTGINNVSVSVTGFGFSTLTLDLDQDGVVDVRFDLDRYSTYSGGIETQAGFRFLSPAKKTKSLGILSPLYGSGEVNLVPDKFVGPLGTGSSTFDGFATIAVQPAVKKAANGFRAFGIGETGYAGIRFGIEQGGTSSSYTINPKYAWLQMRYDFTPGIDRFQDQFSLTILQGYYDDSGNGIRVGQTIPEPGSMSLLGLLALGSYGIGESRRRKRSVTNERATSNDG